jgi:hypothetical protein
MAIGQDIEGLLLQSKPLTDKQFEVDRTVDALFFTLWQFISGGA